MNIYEAKLDAGKLKVAIVVSRFNSFLTDKLLDGALDCLTRHNASDKNIDVYKVPGAFEIPALISKLSDIKKYDAIIALGVIIRGDTPHFEYVANETTKGIASISIQKGIPVAFGIVTADNMEQAIERCGTKNGNKGFDAAMTAIEMANLFKSINE